MIARFKQIAKRLLTLSARLISMRLLSKDETITFLSRYQQAYQPAHHIALPPVYDAADPAKLIFSPKEAVAQPGYVWRVTPPVTKASILPSGTMRIAETVLCTDYWNHHVVFDRWRFAQRPVMEVDTLIAPFGHQPDADVMVFGGYYDFIYLVAAKLCRLRRTMPDSSFTRATVAYPLFGTRYEAEFLALLGFTPDRIVDSRQYEVRARTCLLGNGGDWTYPNVADVMAIREQLAPLIQHTEMKRQRTYISRAGRRRVLNEAALIPMLETYDFTIVEDQSRTLSEQVSIYNQASFIMGPHGASFSNIIWCEPGTHLFELFSPNYAPDYFLYLAQLTGLRYSAYYNGQSRKSRRNSISEDVSVSVSDIERSLNKLFEGEHQPR